jgi:ATP-dependent protease ClpP protease subunit
VLAKQENKHFWQFKNTADKSAELILYGDISTYSWWGDEITPKQFSDDLNALGDVQEIVVRLNSSGGDVFAANAIYTRLKDHQAKITVKVDGWAASAATIVAMAGDTIEIPANAVFMIHDPKMGVFGYFSAEEFVKLSENLAVIKQSIINGYALKTGKDKAEISELMTKATWYDGQQAVEAGFCDSVMFGEVSTEVENASCIIVNSIPFNIDRYPNVPTELLKPRLPGGQAGNVINNSGAFDLSDSQKDKNKSEKTKNGGTGNMEIKNVDELTAAYPDLVKQVAETAAAAERKRIQDIENIALPGFEEIVNKAKFENPAAAADVAMSIVAEQKKQGKNYLDDLDDDITNSNIGEVAAGGQEGLSDAGENPYMAAIDDVLPALHAAQAGAK